MSDEIEKVGEASGKETNRPFQFSIRQLMIATAVVAVFFAIGTQLLPNNPGVTAYLVIISAILCFISVILWRKTLHTGWSKPQRLMPIVALFLPPISLFVIGMMVGHFGDFEDPSQPVNVALTIGTFLGVVSSLVLVNPMTELPKPNRRFWFSLRSVSTWTVMIVLWLWLALPAFDNINQTRHRKSCKNQMQMITQAIFKYETANGHFPPAYIADANGKPMHSWRVLILPYLGDEQYKELHSEYNFDEPWDGPNNSKLHDRVVSIFNCPSDHSYQDSTSTNYVAVVGPETMWPGSRKLKKSDITDISITILIVEKASSDIHWMEPRDLDMNKMDMLMKQGVTPINRETGECMSSKHLGMAHASFTDGSLRAVSDDIVTDVLRALLTATGGDDDAIGW